MPHTFGVEASVPNVLAHIKTGVRSCQLASFTLDKTRLGHSN
jgi:hypothetical protein